MSSPKCTPIHWHSLVKPVLLNLLLQLSASIVLLEALKFILRLLGQNVKLHCSPQSMRDIWKFFPLLSRQRSRPSCTHVHFGFVWSQKCTSVTLFNIWQQTDFGHYWATDNRSRERAEIGQGLLLIQQNWGGEVSKPSLGACCFFKLRPDLANIKSMIMGVYLPTWSMQT